MARRAIAVYGQGRQAKNFALELLGWSRDVVLFTTAPLTSHPSTETSSPATGSSSSKKR
jgi:hypothetical protein